MTAATPRPWFHQGSLLHGPDKGGIDIGPLRAEIYDEADAALIVRAVNSHDDLVAALRELVSLIPKKFTTAPAFDNARALLRDLDASGGER